jgi:hypothetical protein
MQYVSITIDRLVHERSRRVSVRHRDLAKKTGVGSRGLSIGFLPTICPHLRQAASLDAFGRDPSRPKKGESHLDRLADVSAEGRTEPNACA